MDVVPLTGYKRGRDVSNEHRVVGDRCVVAFRALLKYRKIGDRPIRAFRALLKVMETKDKAFVQRMKISKRCDISIKAIRNKAYGNRTGVLHGDRRLEYIRRLLFEKGLGLVPSVHQIEFLQWFLQAVLPWIYKDEWPDAEVRVLENDFKQTKIYQDVITITPRRLGKSWSISMFVSSLMICVPSLTIAIFSTGGRASGMLMTKVKNMMNRVKGVKERMIKENKEEAWISPTKVIKVRRRATFVKWAMPIL